MSPNQVFRTAEYRDSLRVAVERIRYASSADAISDANGIMAGAAFELTLTDALISLIHHQRFGKADPLAQHCSWNFREGTDEPVSLEVAEEAMNTASLQQFVDLAQGAADNVVKSRHDDV